MSADPQPAVHPAVRPAAPPAAEDAGDPSVSADLDAVAAQLRGLGRLGVAFSGGVDSAVLLAVARRTLGDNALGLIAVSPSLARAELDAARRVAAEIGAALVEFATDEGDRDAYRANGVDRCYHCKSAMFERIDDALVAAHRLDAVAYGENATDTARPDRPGSRAASEHRVLRPLADAGLDKARVRALARHLGLSVADKPASPCLASRIPHGVEVTPERLAQIEQAEDALAAAGFAECRVRYHGDVARLEVPVDALGRFADPGLRAQVLAGVRAAGFRHVAVDLAGLQSGAFTLQVLRRGASA